MTTTLGGMRRLNRLLKKANHDMGHTSEIADTRTGEVDSSAGFLARLRSLEDDITRADRVVKECSEALKDAREERENAVLALRNAVKGQQALPLE